MYKRQSTDFVKWLVQMALEDRWPQEAVGSIVCKEDKNNQVILETLDFETQKQVATFNQKETNRVAHLMSPDFQQWLIHQVSEGRWDQDQFVRTVCIKSASKRPTLPLFAEHIQKQIVVLDRTRTCQIIPWLGTNLQEWLYQEAEQGRLDQKVVFKFLEREEREGTQCVTLKIYAGRNHDKSGIQRKLCHNLPDLVLSSLDVSSSHAGQVFGQFELVIGEEKGGCPVYRQAHSKEVPTKKTILLFR